MPSPIGHALAGFTAGTLIDKPGMDGRARRGVLFAGLGMLADVDLLFGAHSARTHSIGAAAIVFVAVAIAAAARGRRTLWRRTEVRRQDEGRQPDDGHRPSVVAQGFSLATALRLALACSLAYATHVLLDWLGADTTAPYGIMALWPLSTRYFISGVDLFMSITRRYWLPEFFWWNLRAAARELLILTPLALLAWWAEKPRRATRA